MREDFSLQVSWNVQCWKVLGPQDALCMLISQIKNVVHISSRCLIYYCTSNYKKARMSSFSIQARTIEHCDGSICVVCPAGQNPQTAVMNRTEMEKQEAAKAQPWSPLSDWSRMRPGQRNPRQQEKLNRLTLSDSFSFRIGQISPLLAIWLNINGLDTRMNSLK